MCNIAWLGIQMSKNIEDDEPCLLSKDYNASISSEIKLYSVTIKLEKTIKHFYKLLRCMGLEIGNLFDS